MRDVYTLEEKSSSVCRTNFLPVGEPELAGSRLVIGELDAGERSTARVLDPNPLDDPMGSTRFAEL